MTLESPRAFRKTLHLDGVIFLNGEEREIVVKNMSITGLLAELTPKKGVDEDIKEIFQALKISTLVDIFVPSLRLGGQMEVNRADIEGDKILIALEYKTVSYDVDDLAYRRNLLLETPPLFGRILLNDGYYSFSTVNVSFDGIMIRTTEKAGSEESGTKIFFEFDKLGLNGHARVIWSEQTQDNETLMGLRFEQIEGHSETLLRSTG